MGNFYRCPRSWASSWRIRSRDSFGDALFSVDPTAQLPELGDSNAGLWADAGCGLHCPMCVEQMQRDPLTLASAWLRAVVADVAQAVPRYADTAVYVATVRVMSAICGVVAAKGALAAQLSNGGSPPATSSSSSSGSKGAPAPPAKPASPCVAPVYSDVLRLLEDSWHRTADSRRCRPFLRLRSGRLLQLKLIIELCFAEAFAPAPHAARLSEIAIRIFSALETHDAAVLWSSLQQLTDPERRAHVVGPGHSTESHAACVMLQLQGYAALLVHPWRPLEACGCPVEEALRRMTEAVQCASDIAPTEVRWLVSWELVHSADRLFRHADADRGAQRGDPDAMGELLQTWAVRSVAEVAIWQCGDPYAAIVAVNAVRALILWRGLLLQQDEAQRKKGGDVRRGPLLTEVERILASVSAHCAAAAGSDEVSAAEARAVSMLLNDHHMAGAPQIAAQQPCLLHTAGATRDRRSRGVGQDTHNLRPLAGRQSNRCDKTRSEPSNQGGLLWPPLPTASALPQEPDDSHLEEHASNYNEDGTSHHGDDVVTALPADGDTAFRLLSGDMAPDPPRSHAPIVLRQHGAGTQSSSVAGIMATDEVIDIQAARSREPPMLTESEIYRFPNSEARPHFGRTGAEAPTELGAFGGGETQDIAEQALDDAFAASLLPADGDVFSELLLSTSLGENPVTEVEDIV